MYRFTLIAALGLAASNSLAADEVFGLTKVHQFHLSVTDKDYKAMDPPPINPFAMGAKGPGFGNPDAGAGNFGFEFAYVHADFEAEGKALKGVGLRYKGSGSYLMSQRSAKRSFKLDLDRYDKKLAFHGLTKFNLNNGALDPTRAREAPAYALFRAAGVPACRTALAEVTLSVPNKFDHEYLGVFTLVEQVDKSFLKAHFKDGTGMLLKPEGIRGLPHFGDDRAAYEKSYNLKSEASDAQWKRLVEFTRLVHKSDDAMFRQNIRSFLDVESFTRFLAVNTYLSSLDGFLGLGHNYYLYLSPVTNQFTFFPWDLDLAFGGFFLFGTTDQLAELSIDHPHTGENKLIDRLLAMPDVKSAYRAEIKRLAESVFTPAKFGKDVAAVEAIVKDLLVKEKKSATARKEADFGIPGLPAPPTGANASLEKWVAKRATSVNDQLAGKSKGTEPVMAFGGMAPPPGPGNQLAKPLLDLLDINKDGRVSSEEFTIGMKKLFEAWDRDRNGSLDQIEISMGIQRLVPAGPPKK